ncbi:hypothetical protein DFH09DRAFT_1099804 [Mycena vulgaris]|nr:hypothetical protein DFH09DRAFT_1099804 [Mycena vulgaris]
MTPKRLLRTKEGKQEAFSHGDYIQTKRRLAAVKKTSSSNDLDAVAVLAPSTPSKHKHKPPPTLVLTPSLPAQTISASPGVTASRTPLPLHGPAPMRRAVGAYPARIFLLDCGSCPSAFQTGRNSLRGAQCGAKAYCVRGSSIQSFFPLLLPDSAAQEYGTNARKTQRFPNPSPAKIIAPQRCTFQKAAEDFMCSTGINFESSLKSGPGFPS